MQTTLIFLMAGLVFASCQRPRPDQSSAAETRSPAPLSESVTESPTPYFKGVGNEPGWSLSIFEDQIRFTSMLTGWEEVTIPHAEPARAADANVRRYRLETEAVQMDIGIQQQPCADVMSGEPFPYQVTISIRRTGEEQLETLSGCGHFVTDDRLHDIWVLEQLDGAAVAGSDYPKELPRMEINARENTFSGQAGCNRMEGSLFFERGVLRFTHLRTTKMACPALERESALLAALERATTYSIADNRLSLLNPDGVQAVFRKVD